MTPEILAYLHTEQLLRPHETVVCAVSGGADSVAMLVFLKEHAELLDITLRAAHFNHNLRGDESDGDERYVRELCDSFGIPLSVGSGDVSGYAAEHGCGIEEAARTLRYRFLEDTFPEPALIATAHTADDNIETVLMHLLRGAGMNGLSGIPPRRGRIIRPILPASHHDCEEFLRERGIAWREDSTNNEDDCLRNRLRHHVIPLLKEENPSVSDVVLQSSLRLREENSYLDQSAAELLGKAAVPGGYDCTLLRAAPRVLVRRALRQLAAGCGSSTVDRLLSILEQPQGGRLSLQNGSSAVFSCGVLRILHEPQIFTSAEQFISVGQDSETVFGKWIFRFRFPEAIPSVRPKNGYYLRFPRQDESLTLRCRRTGDRVHLHCGHKDLKKAMIDCKIPVTDRSALPILCYGDIPVLIPLLGCDPDYRAKDSDTPIILVQYLQADCPETENEEMI